MGKYGRLVAKTRLQQNNGLASGRVVLTHIGSLTTQTWAQVFYFLVLQYYLFILLVVDCAGRR
jgi:hypothetical protein